MGKIFNVEDRQKALDYIIVSAGECSKIVSLVQVGSGAEGFHDEKSDLDFVVAYDSNDSMIEVMEYMHRKITEKYSLLFFTQSEERHLQVYVLDNLLEIDIGFGCYEHAAALKPAFKVLFDNSGIVEEKMVKSREGMDERIYKDKQKKDLETACNFIWTHLMHAAVAIYRNNYFRVVGELEFVRKIYIDLVGDRYKLESTVNREIDKLPDFEKEAIKSTYVIGESQEVLWNTLINLTNLVYMELEGNSIPISKEMLLEYYKELKLKTMDKYMIREVFIFELNVRSERKGMKNDNGK